MSNFVRNSPWLKFAFPPSTTPDAGPARTSDDCQLTADYTGGGYGMPEPNQWFSSATVTKTADNQFKLFDAGASIMPLNQNTRLIAAGVANIGAAQVVLLQALLFVQRGDGIVTVPICNNQGLIPATAPAGYPGYFLNINPTMMIGGEPTRLGVFFNIGDNVIYTFTFYFITVPRGIMVNP